MLQTRKKLSNLPASVNLGAMQFLLLLSSFGVSLNPSIVLSKDSCRGHEGSWIEKDGAGSFLGPQMFVAAAPCRHQ